MALPRSSVCAVGVLPLPLLLLGLLCSGPPAASAAGDYFVVISPQSPVLEIGTNFTATCVITNTSQATADDLYWMLGVTRIPREQYSRVNNSAISVTVQVTGEQPTWMFCKCEKKSDYIRLHEAKFVHGILLGKGYRPERPENVSCEAIQEDTFISSIISCVWEPVARQTEHVPTKYTLFVKVVYGQTYNVTTRENHGQVPMRIFPNHMSLQIWVEASNLLETVQSEPLIGDAGWFVKTNPPSNVKLIPEKSFPTSLLMNWTRPIAKEYLKLTHQIRYCPKGSHNWTYVPQADTSKDIQTFRLQYLRPDTLYVIQVRCKNAREGHGYWSEWSHNATKRTPEDRPRSKTDLWAVFSDGNASNGRQVQIVCKDPVMSNGRITRFNMSMETQKDKARNGSVESLEIPVKRPNAESISNQRIITVLTQIQLPHQKRVKVRVTAFNSVGKSPEAQLGIREKGHELGPVVELKVWPEDGQLWLEWKPPNITAVSEYVVEWKGGDQLDWQRENRSTRRTAIRGNLEKYVCYNVSVYPLYSGWIGKPTRAEAYLEQGAPLEGPSIRLNGPPGRNEAELVWNHVPLQMRQGFITNYTIFYGSTSQSHNVTVPANVTSYTLTSLSTNTKYDTYIRVSTARGSAVGFRHSFTTLKYAPGEIELIVVAVSLGFLFVVLMTMFLCIYKRDVIKRNFWPWIPNPGESTIRDWSPDHALKAEGATESCLSGFSVLNVDMCDGKSVFEEDKASLPLKKDKYLSEEHSSGIGGSSCMSSPRQSVSDSDEGGDMADTTASTVQYSSVVPSSGYKGQTPGSQAQQAVFSRSESTQPLLESEDHPDMSGQEGSRQSHTAAAANPDGGFTQLEMEPQGLLEPKDFCSLDDDGGAAAPIGGAAGPASSYMPQVAGYRPQ